MNTKSLPLAAAAALAVLCLPRFSTAQTFEAVGTRAQGMGGAFVAVADDATATWWNPAGLATGAYFSAVLERGSGDEPSAVPPPGPARRQTAGGLAVAFPAFGLSYYRLNISEIAPPSSTALQAGDRQVNGATVPIRLLKTSQFGATFGQSVGHHFVVASTLRLLRGGVAGAASTATGTDALDEAAKLDPGSETHGDLDLGGMLSFGSVRLGGTVKHLPQPSFGDASDQVTLKRQARVGMAVVGHTPGIVSGLTVAVDGDLTKTATAFGDVRHFAAGIEAGLYRGRIQIRSGFTRNTVGESRPSWSAGASVALKRGVYIDGSTTQGSDQALKSWSAAFRFAL